MNLRHVSVFLSLVVLGLLPQRAFAGGHDKDHIDINPLITFSEQLQELNTECANRPLDRDCEERKEQIKGDIRKLREICRKDWHDERCQALSPPHENFESTAENYCRSHAQEPRCVRRREYAKRRTKYNAVFCSKNPDAKRCQGEVTRTSGAVDIAEYCKVFPEKKRCVRYFKAKNENKPRSEPEINTF
ncbi:MAG: hypothetical protein U0136_14375 [Bdellovibrionota bacterium]